MPLLRTIEGLRFVSAVGIACIHILPHVDLAPPPSFDLFVDLFFVVSGIVIGSIYVGRIHSPAEWGIFLRKRFARIYPLHLATLIFYIILGFGVLHFHLRIDDPARFDPRHIPANLLLVQAWFPWGRLSYNFVSWSISAETFVYILFPLIGLAVAAGRMRGLATVALLLGLAVALAEFGLKAPLFDLRWNSGILRAVPSFAFGVWLSVFAQDLPISIRRHAGTLFHVFALLFGIGLFIDVSGYILLTAIYALVALGYLADLGSQTTLLAAKSISAQGRYTYSIYMLHVPVTTVFLSFLLPHLLGVAPVARAASVVLTFLVLAGASIASFHLFESPLRTRLAR